MQVFRNIRSITEMMQKGHSYSLHIWPDSGHLKLPVIPRGAAVPSTEYIDCGCFRGWSYFSEKIFIFPFVCCEQSCCLCTCLGAAGIRVLLHKTMALDQRGLLH